MIEIWKSITDYENLYKISSYGNIKRITGRILKSSVVKKHLIITLSKNGIAKNCYVHRLVLETFIGPCPSGMECRHLDGNPENNKLNNLKWGTRSDNQKDSLKHGTHRFQKTDYIRYQPNTRGSKHGMSKLNNNEIIKIRKLFKEEILTQREIAKIFNVSQGTIWFIIHKKTWKNTR